MKLVKMFLVVMMMLALTSCKDTETESSSVEGTNEVQNITLNQDLYFNDFKFQLGVKLDTFLEKTQVVLNEEQYEAALASTNKMAGLYYAVEGTLEEKDMIIKLTLYIDTSDLERVTVEGISITSDRGWEEQQPGFLSDPNLVTCGFVFLDGYDIDKDTFTTFSKEYQDLAEKRKNKYTEKYDLKISDGDFGIEVEFDSLKESSTKIYITEVTVTNKMDLAW